MEMPRGGSNSIHSMMYLDGAMLSLYIKYIKAKLNEVTLRLLFKTSHSGSCSFKISSTLGSTFKNPCTFSSRLA